MDFPYRFPGRIKVEIRKKEIIVFIILLMVVGILSAIKPSYTLTSLIGLGLLTVLTIGALNPPKAFLGMGIFLIFQVAIVRNMIVLGTPENMINLVKRIDEFIWLLFIVYIVLNNYRGTTWEIRKTNLDSFAIIFVGLGLISTLVNHNSLFWSLIAIFLTLKGFIMYWIAKNLKFDEQMMILFFKGIIFILVFAAFIGILQFLGIPIGVLSMSERLGIKYVPSIFAHHGIFGTLMAVGIALTIGLKLGTGDNKWTFLATILLLGLIVSSVRRSLAGLLLGLLFVLLNYKRFKISKRYIYSIAGIFTLLLVLFGGRISTVAKTTTAEYGISGSSAARYWLYYGASQIIKNKPFFGEGPGKYGSFISVLTKSEIYEKYNIIITDDNKMDAYWPNIIGEYGLLGFIIIFFLLLILFRTLLKCYPKDDKTPFIRGLHISYIILFVDYAVESLVSPIYLGSLTAFMLFTGIGMIVSISAVNSE